ncbi:hypothetical protein BKA62DRAFT_771775 [Auriculariales sp. MPI-PUGE-AT-0066]|nr:hypothetical protein BKA62DRAFT_771775 [Auriculariales sp. MPI-PUGE-AT-0066]
MSFVRPPPRTTPHGQAHIPVFAPPTNGFHPHAVFGSPQSKHQLELMDQSVMFGSPESSIMTFPGSPGMDASPLQALSPPLSTPPTPAFDHNELARLQRENEALRNFNHSILQQLAVATGLPADQLPAYYNPAFRADWQLRKHHRRNLYCASNRNGISSCSWHNSRHQPKDYGARQAPPGVLNCGCTHEEALFEASLSANGVGAYKSGTGHQRLDPALRRSLLQLLQRRYNYQDGDFEVDAKTGQWHQGQDAAVWHHRQQTGQKE